MPFIRHSRELTMSDEITPEQRFTEIIVAYEQSYADGYYPPLKTATPQQLRSIFLPNPWTQLNLSESPTGGEDFIPKSSIAKAVAEAVQELRYKDFLDPKRTQQCHHLTTSWIKDGNGKINLIEASEHVRDRTIRIGTIGKPKPLGDPEKGPWCIVLPIDMDVEVHAELERQIDFMHEQIGQPRQFPNLVSHVTIHYCIDAASRDILLECLLTKPNPITDLVGKKIEFTPTELIVKRSVDGAAARPLIYGYSNKDDQNDGPPFDWPQ